MSMLVENYLSQERAYSITDAPIGLTYDQHAVVNRASAVSLARSHPETWRIITGEHMASFLDAFKGMGWLHILELVATISEPVIAATVDPKGGSGAQIAAIMKGSVASAVGIESIITDAGKGQIKADAVAAQTTAVVGVVNQVLAEQGKPALPANTAALAASVVKSSVDALNVVAATVAAAPAA